MRPQLLTPLGPLLLAALLAPGAAVAGEPPSPDAPAAAPAQQDAAPPAKDAAPPAAKGSPDERAAELYNNGNIYYDDGKYKEAEGSYQAAWNIAKSFDVAGNLGNVELMIGQPREAAEHLSYALKIFPLGSSAEKRKFLQGRLAEAKKQIATLRVAVNVTGAEVFVDGKPVGKSPMDEEIFVDPGDRLIEARIGDKLATETVTVARGSSQPVSLSIDTGPNMTIVIAGGAVGVAGIGAGVVFAILSNGKATDAEAAPPRSDERAGLRDDQTLMGNLSFWSFVGGGVALAGTAIYALTAGSAATAAGPTQTGVRALPLVTANGGGLLVGGRF